MIWLDSKISTAEAILLSTLAVIENYHNNLNLKERTNMESDDGFPKQGGEALEIGDEFDSEEEGDDMPSAAPDAMRQPMKANIAASSGPGGGAGANAAKAADVKGKQVED